MAYDSKVAIEESLHSLEAFKSLLKERQIAGYNRHERLGEYIVKGQWTLDTCGNCMEIEEPLNVPYSVMTMEEIRNGDYGHWRASMANIPSATIFCPICKQCWTIDNAKDSRSEHSREYALKGEIFIGKTLLQVKNFLNTLTDGKYLIASECNVRNDKYIDLTPKEGYSTLVENQIGWIDAKDDYVISENDDISYNKWTYYHTACLAKREEAKAQELITSNGVGYNKFHNLAGDENCDFLIKAELTICGIRIIDHKCNGEVAAHVTGVLGKNDDFEFTRAWHYWVVSGNVPLSIANELYQSEVGAKYVRVAGHCGCPAPEEPWISWIDDDGKKLALLSELEKYKGSSVYEYCIKDTSTRWVDDPKKEGKPYVTTYHIDTLPGLKLFAEKIIAAYGVGQTFIRREDIKNRLNNIS